MKLLVLGVITACLFSSLLAEDVRLDNLEPNEAQQYIESKDQSLKYAPKVDSNVPAVRVLGKTPTNVLEDIYLANQYHGQDGLGGYLYGYAVPDIAKTEKKKAGGDLKGAYQYTNEDGQEIKVEYWDDGTGFHQIDNVPKILPKQVDDAPDVKAAKEEHFRRWHEEAERNSRPPTNPQQSQPYLQQAQYQPQSSQYQQQSQPGQYQQQPQPGQYQQQPQPGQYQSQPQQGQYQQGQPGQYQQHPQPGQYQQQPQPGQHQPGQYPGQQGQPGQYQQGQQPQPGHYQSPDSLNNIDYTGQYTSNQQSYAEQPNKEWEYKEGEEERGPPRGFFYNFDYPVGIIVNKQGEPHKRESLGQVYNQNKAEFEHQLQSGSGTGGPVYPSYQVHA